ncbi:general transcription factor IIIC subunit l(2)37Cd [Lycorma delicatula]|uniref:general transcription factor IIIC subunit l(2)37Cd n=1 Tax=Lycorma delicatula TaxID=130591 RepID=UPI003F510975
MEAFNQKKYTCVVYPGVVNDEEKMLATLGGLESISVVCSKPNRRLELRFRPDDVYCRSACGDRQKTVSFLLKVKVKRKKNPEVSNPANLKTGSENNVICEPIVMGRVETTFNFRTLCDFQYLPMQTNKNGDIENIYDKLVPKDFPSVDWFDEPAPPFLPPAAFSRMDSVQLYLYRKESKDSKTDHTPANIIGRTRCRRSAHAVFVTFDVPAAPTKPRVNSLKYLELKFLAGEPHTILSELFKKRPVWSKTALAFETKYTKEQLKYLLPTVAYYFVTGPFRVMWVRMGYDPRKDPSSRIYQTLDYRIPNRGGLCRLVKAKRRTDSMLLFKSVNSAQSKTISIMKDSKENGQESNGNSDEQKVHYIFQRGVKLPARQIFYQYCDIKVPEVEEMFARLPKPSADTECHRQRGWLPAGFAERVREIITRIIFEEVEKEKVDEGIKEGVAGTSEEQDEEEFEEDDEDDTDDDSDEEPLSGGNNTDDGSDDGVNSETKQILQNIFQRLWA